MAQRRGLQPLLANLKRQGVKVLTALQQEIAKREKELADLKTTATRWGEMVGRGRRTSTTDTAQSPVRTGKKRRQRIDWNAVLADLPTAFDAKDVQRQTGKPIEQVYAGLSRWTKDKKVKRVANGSYQKASSAAPTQPKKG
jgi:hypothetical protein